MKGKYINLTPGRLIVLEWKANEVKQNIEAGKLSYSKSSPLLVSYFPDEKKYLIMDGHHRAMQLIKEGAKELRCLVSEHQPKTYVINYPILTLKKFLAS